MTTAVAELTAAVSELGDGAGGADAGGVVAHAHANVETRGQSRYGGCTGRNDSCDSQRVEGLRVSYRAAAERDSGVQNPSNVKLGRQAPPNVDVHREPSPDRAAS